MDYQIGTMHAADWETVRRIYLEGIATGQATFETSAPSWKNWDFGHFKHSRLVAKSTESVNKEILGWAALSPVSSRNVYSGVAEVSIYVGEKGRGKGVGTFLLKSLIQSAEKNGIWTLPAGLFPDNTASLNLHLHNGFREVGRRE